MKKGAIILFPAIAIATLFMSGCQNKDIQNKENIKIYYSAIESGTYYEGWANQLEEQAKQHGFAFDVGYAENSIEVQDAQIKNAVAQGCDVFLCGPISSDIVTEIKAAAGSVPMVFINNAPSEKQLEKDRYIYVASDEFMAGQYQAEYLLENLGEKEEINVILLKGPKGASGTIGRTDGLKQTLKASGKKINYVFEDYADWNENKAKELIQMFLKTGRMADCVVANNDDMALGGIAAFEEMGMSIDSILFLGVDASTNGCQAILDGKMDFTVYQAMSDQIAVAVEAAGKLAAGESIQGLEGATEDGKYILIPFEKVDSRNVANYQS